MEEWIKLENNNNLAEVSNFGRFKIDDAIIIPKISTDGYPYWSAFRLHVIVATVWVPKPDSNEALVVNHKDCDKSNFHFTNLEWITNAQNVQHAAENGCIPLTPTQIVEIYDLILNSKKKYSVLLREIAYKYKIRDRNVHRIRWTNGKYIRRVLENAGYQLPSENHIEILSESPSFPHGERIS